MVSVRLTCTAAEQDELIAELYGRGTTGIVEMAGAIEAYFDTVEEARDVVEAFPAHEPLLHEHAPRNYVEEFQQSWQPIAIGKHLWLTPPWDTDVPPAGRLRVDFQPGMACGSGAHPCTQMCLEAVERLLRPADSILDVGVGSGILLLAAGALGAGFRAGCDIDHESVVIASQNVDVPLWTGSTKSVRSGAFDLVVANISAPAVDLLLADLRRIARRALVVSGFREAEVRPSWGVFRTEIREGWACLLQE